MNDQLFQTVFQHWQQILAWGLLATGCMTTVLEGTQLTGFSRLSLPFLFGTFIMRDRQKATIAGYFLYMAGAWLFAFVYAFFMEAAQIYAWWFGALLGLVHGLFLVTVFLPILPYVHPHVATEYDGPNALRRLEPPGKFGLNYGRATPLTTVAAQILFGLIFAAGYGH